MTTLEVYRLMYLESGAMRFYNRIVHLLPPNLRPEIHKELWELISEISTTGDNHGTLHTEHETEFAGHA